MLLPIENMNRHPSTDVGFPRINDYVDFFPNAVTVHLIQLRTILHSDANHDGGDDGNI